MQRDLEQDPSTHASGRPCGLPSRTRNPNAPRTDPVARAVRRRHRRRPRHRPRIPDSTPCAGSASAAARSPRSVRPRFSGTVVLDAKGLVVAPGFIDMHAHGHSDESYRLYAMNGVTTALELEAGTHDVPAWYTARDGKSLLNYGITSEPPPVARARLQRPGSVPADGRRGQRRRDAGADRRDRRSASRPGSRPGGLGVGMGLQYTPGATKWEVLEMFRAAAAAKAPVFVHTRSWGTTDPGSSVESFMEVIRRREHHRGAAPYRAPQQHEPVADADDAADGGRGAGARPGRDHGGVPLQRGDDAASNRPSSTGSRTCPTACTRRSCGWRPASG